MRKRLPKIPYKSDKSISYRDSTQDIGKDLSNPEIGKIYVISKGKSFFSIALQEEVITTREVLVELTNKVIDKNYFGKLKMCFQNIALCSLVGDGGKGYADRAHGDCAVNVSNLELMELNKYYY